VKGKVNDEVNRGGSAVKNDAVRRNNAGRLVK
jgi:hypothetical protein